MLITKMMDDEMMKVIHIRWCRNSHCYIGFIDVIENVPSDNCLWVSIHFEVCFFFLVP